ncbi:MAG: hypothetical protein JWO94_3133, partial [Verrucomicrobiaceae bacterium]|nr:hypothetical protein [Verrucomicrobiaceae bacterium]
MKVDGKSTGSGTVQTITNVQATHLIAATFVKLPVITAKQAAGGSISPPGSTVIPYAGSQTYTITPDSGYDISSLLINGKAAAVAGIYPFTNVTVASATISALYKLRSDHVLITATAGAGGGVSPAGKIPMGKGESQLFSFTPSSTAYRILDVKVDGKSVGTAGTYTITNVQVPHAIVVTFTTGTHLVAASSPSGGTITPSGALQVVHGKDQSFVVNPPPGFKAGIRVDGVLKAQEATGKSLTYVVKKVDRPHQVLAVYAPVGSQFTGTLGITLVGLGDTISVANASPAAFSILTNGTLGVGSVFFGNLTARSWGRATASAAPDSWAAKVALLPGDNDLWFAAVSLDGSAAWYPARVTYYPSA